MSLVSSSMLAQVQDEELVTVTQPEVSASFPGGLDSLRAFIQKNLEYPPSKPDKPEGRVFVDFIIMKDGSLSEIKIVKGLGDPYDKCVLDLFHIMPKWNPAMHRGKAVEIRMVYPVTFRF
jgi:periplasmic protein TonB